MRIYRDLPTIYGCYATKIDFVKPKLVPAKQVDGSPFLRFIWIHLDISSFEAS